MCFDMERYNMPTGGHLYMDVSGAGFRAVDMRMSSKVNELFTKYYPCAFKKVFIYGIPSLIRPFITTVVSLLPEKYKSQVSFPDKDQVRHVEATTIELPEGISNLEKVGLACGIPEKSIEKEMKYMRELKEKHEKVRLQLID
jgi:hypothetical protein